MVQDFSHQQYHGGKITIRGSLLGVPGITLDHGEFSRSKSVFAPLILNKPNTGVHEIIPVYNWVLVFHLPPVGNSPLQWCFSNLVPPMANLLNFW